MEAANHSASKLAQCAFLESSEQLAGAFSTRDWTFVFACFFNQQKQVRESPGFGRWEAEKETQNLSFSKKCFLNFFLAVLGLCCCAGSPLVVVSGGCVRRLLLLWSTGSRASGFRSGPPAQQLWLRALEPWLSSHGAWACSLCGMWALPCPGTEPVIPALAGGFFTPELPAKPRT